MSKIKPTNNGTKKDVIIKSAASLFRKKGFAGTSMRELAVNIGVEAPSLYNHIGSKSELLQSICLKVANDFMLHLDEVEKENSSAVEKLEKIIRFHIYMMVNDNDEVFVANHEWKQLQDPFLSSFLQQRKIYEKRLVEIVQNGIEHQTIKFVNPTIAVITILSAVRGLEFWQGFKKNIDEKELEKNMVDHLLKGLVK
jgi:hypothetical protein